MPREGAADAFALVGNEHRVAILRALLDAHADPEAPYPTPFARLRERAGVDVSAQFAYHLEELVGAFVARTGDGYRLRYAGWKAAAALAAGTYTTQPAFGPTAIDGACAHCESNALHASYGDAWLTVTCHDCERVLTRYPFPPGAAADRLDTGGDGRTDPVSDPDGGLDALLAAFDDRVRSHFALAVDGVCPECAGRMHTALEPTEGDAQNATRGDGHDCHAVADCTQCGNHLTIPVGCVLLADPDALAYAASHDVALADRTFWTVPALAAPERVTWTANNSPASDSGATDSLEATVALTDDSDASDGSKDSDGSDASDGSKDSDGSDASDDTDAPAVVVTGDLDVELPDRD